MDGQKRRRGRQATGHSVDSLEAQKFKRAVWSGSRSRVWLTKRVHQAWEISKRMSLFKTDNDFAARLLSLHGNGNGQAVEVVISMFFTNWLWINSRLPSIKHQCFALDGKKLYNTDAKRMNV